METINGLFIQLIEYKFLGNPLLQWLIAAGIALLTFFIALIVRRVATKRLAKFASRTATHVDDFVVGLLRRTNALVLLAGAIYIGSLTLLLTDPAQRVLTGVLMIAVAIQALVWAHQIVNFSIDSFVARRQTAADEPDQSLVAAVGVAKFILLVAIYAFIVLFALSNMGVNIAGLITGLGIGGIAIALAVQNVLGDLFGSLSIVLDKPFVVGDFIIVGDEMGTVERIGIKTTRVRALSGEQLVFANSDLLNSRIQNFKRMNERRVVFAVGVTYQTPLEKLKLIPKIITNAVNAQKTTRFDRSHFKGFGGSSLDFETVYYVLDRDYNIYMDIQQAINLEIVRRFEDECIEFAYPTQTLFIANSQGGGVNGLTSHDPAGRAGNAGAAR